MSDSSEIKTSLNYVRTALLSIAPERADGFEGLLAVVLSEISGMNFRLAKSGSQRGRDGGASSENQYICFEAKRYDRKIPRADLLVKIADIGLNDASEVDLWILGATVEVAEQDKADVKALSAKEGIDVLILDWSNAQVPPLAVLLASASKEATDFLVNNASGSVERNQLCGALRAIREDPRFSRESKSLLAKLSGPSVGHALAAQKNERWLETTFSNKDRARNELGQPLAPAAVSTMAAIERPRLTGQIQKALFLLKEEGIGAVLGGEGVGKSWLMAQAWLSLTEKPLLVVLTSDSINALSRPEDISELLVRKIVQQTDDVKCPASESRWHRRFRYWRQAESREPPNILVWLDGLNQNTSVDWPRWLDAIAAFVFELGGQLIITCREKFFIDRIEGNLHASPQKILVPQFSNDEVMSGLTSIRGGPRISVADLQDFHRNPRILGIAIELWARLEILDFSELSLDRLLFEYLRTVTQELNEAQTTQDYANKIVEHAEEIYSRVQEHDYDDLAVFNGAWQEKISAITESRFFEPLGDDPTKYTLKEDTLPFALGLSLVDALKKVLRNSGDLSQTIEGILEPIEGLDRTAEIVFASITIGCLDCRCADKICAALIESFLQLQNPDEKNRPAFASIARVSISSFLLAAEAIYSTRKQVNNRDWLEETLTAASVDEACWASISASVRIWLSYLSLRPETWISKLGNQGSLDQIEKTMIVERGKLKERIESLTSLERNFLENRLIKQEDTSFGSDDLADHDALAQKCFILLAGKPIAPFAESFVNWCFARSLAGSPFSPREAFMHLIRFNRVDWKETRVAISQELAVLKLNSLSRTGDWAIVGALRATGDIEDARDAEERVTQLLSGRVSPHPWRLVEDYCSADPCDPQSDYPKNVRQTAESYNKIDVSNLLDSSQLSREMHFFQDARPGIVRFESSVAVGVHQRFASEVSDSTLCKHSLPAQELRQHTPLFTDGIVKGLIARSREIFAADGEDSYENRGSKFDAQFGYIACFPHIDSERQMKELLSLPPEIQVLRDLVDSMKPIYEERFETEISRAYNDEDDKSLFKLLLFAQYTDTPISEKARGILSKLISTKDRMVRAVALCIAWHLKDDALTRAVVESGWSAKMLCPNEDHNERWYGSWVILQAAEKGVLGIDQALDRIAPSHYGFAARCLGREGAQRLSFYIDAALEKILPTHDFPRAPIMERQVLNGDTVDPPLVDLSQELDRSSGTFKEVFENLNETPERFLGRQSGIQNRYREFAESLTMENARLALEDFDLDGFLIIARENPDSLISWSNRFETATSSQLRHMKNMALMTATALSHIDPERSFKLFKHVSGTSSFLDLVSGLASIPLETKCIWKSADNAPLDELRFERLDNALNDHQIAIETLAAIEERKGNLIVRYVRSRLDMGIPADIARALTVAGFCDESDEIARMMNAFSDTVGFVGEAHKAARFAYERNLWARHWHREICNAQSPEEFWRHGVLRNKIVDGRFDVWEPEFQRNNNDLLKFWASTEGGLKQRIKKWRTKREKALFGQQCPPEIYLR